MAVPRSFEQQAARDAMRAFAHSHNVADAARDECGAAWRGLWAPLAELGLFSVAVREECGGAGGTLVDAAAMLEQAGAELVPGPLAATVVGGLVCSTDSAVPQVIYEGVLTGALPVAMATGNTASILRVGADGRMYLTGAYPGVDGACSESVLILPASLATKPSGCWCRPAPMAST
jgi:alkylation response protein AidB-like acyl-CoA dehydrogenase